MKKLTIIAVDKKSGEIDRLLYSQLEDDATVPSFTVAHRDDLIALIQAESVDVETSRGAKVEVDSRYGRSFLITERNNIHIDNLGNLPTFQELLSAASYLQNVDNAAALLGKSK